MAYESGLSVEERVASLFQPDTLLPAQYLETVRRKTHLESEKKLMLAVLEDAVACFQKYAPARDVRGQSLFREAEEWILQGDRNDWLFSFDSICEALDLNPKYIREGLLSWREKQPADRPKATVFRLSTKNGARRPVEPGEAERKLRRAAGR